MIMSILRCALILLVLGFGAAVPGVSEGAARPTIVGLTVVLEDGRSYALSSRQLSEPRGGAIFWGDWAVANLLLPQYSARPSNLMNAAKAMALWFTPGASGQLPAFLVNTPEGPVYPLDQPSDQGWVFPLPSRPKLARISVEYADGRLLSLTEFALRDPKSGVMVWTDFAVANFFIPFYRGAKGLPTRPEDVMRIWHQPAVAPGVAASAQTSELPAFLVKPACIPSYPSSEVIQ